MLDFKQYIKELQSVPIDEITEHSKRFALETLLRDLAVVVETGNALSIQQHQIKVLHEPRRKDSFGSPDFKIYTDNSIIGYVENKKISENLDKILKSKQIVKYRELSQNILLTNYIDFVWIKGDRIQRETLCYLSDIENKRFKVDNEKSLKVEQLIVNFYSQPPIGLANAKDLALALAVRSKNLKDFLNEELAKFKEDDENNDDFLFGLYKTFKSYIFKQLTISEFSDAFAQMLVYGLFLAKLNADTKTVTLENAKSYIPQSFQLIKELVSFLDKLDNPDYSDTKWIIDETISLMNNLDLIEIKKSLSYKNPQGFQNLEGWMETDPYIYFYETFLAAYDSKLRKAKGVYYTPPQVVNFIIRGINDILKTVFKISSGLAAPGNVTVLDFATGTGTFLIEILKQIFDTLPPNSNALKDMLIKDHILKNIYGFEYLIAPYTIAHLKLSQYLNENGYKLTDQDRFQIFLTNTLEPIADIPPNIFVKTLSKEGKLAQQVKDKPILVITGNPPYSGHSKNTGDWITNLLKGHDIWATEKSNYQANYFEVDGKPLGERNPKWLQDDYVKFIRFAQYKMDRAGQGVVGIITNHSFLDNPTFRGMRQSLMKSFDHLYFIDLHGNNKKKEKAPDGEKDQNIFDIEQGVAISIMVKKQGLEKKVYHADFWGTRKQKFEQCVENSLESIEFIEIKPNSPFYLFIPQNQDNLTAYNRFWSARDIFSYNNIGIATGKDEIFISFNDKEQEQKITNTYNVFNNTLLTTIAYRPFDLRQIYYDHTLLERSRKNIVVNYPIDNLTLITTKISKNDGSEFFDAVFVSEKIVDIHMFRRSGAYMFPLFIIRNGVEKTFFGVAEPLVSYGNQKIENRFVKTENFTNEFRDFVNRLYSSIPINPNEIKEKEKRIKVYHTQLLQIEKLIQSFEKTGNDMESIRLQKQIAEQKKTSIAQLQKEIDCSNINNSSNYRPTAEQIFHYIYAILHSKIYREKYADFLKIDFPRIPFVEDFPTFESLAKIGEEIVIAHTKIKAPHDTKFNKTINFLGCGDNIILKSEFNANKLYINKTQYFEPIPENVYCFYIGGYQVLDKYIKDRKNREIELSEVETIKSIINVLEFTIHRMTEIDSLVNDWI